MKWWNLKLLSRLWKKEKKNKTILSFFLQCFQSVWAAKLQDLLVEFHFGYVLNVFLQCSCMLVWCFHIHVHLFKWARCIYYLWGLMMIIAMDSFLFLHYLLFQWWLVGKQPMAWKEYCEENWWKEHYESMIRCTVHLDITEMMLKMALNTIQSVNQSFEMILFDFCRLLSTILQRVLTDELFDVKALRAFRVLRPLRLVSRAPSKYT